MVACEEEIRAILEAPTSEPMLTSALEYDWGTLSYMEYSCFSPHLAWPARSGAVVKMFWRCRPPTLIRKIMSGWFLKVCVHGNPCHVSPCIESRCYGNNGDVKGVEGGAGGQQSWWLNHSNQTCESEDKMRVGVNDNVNICSYVDLHGPKEIENRFTTRSTGPNEKWGYAIAIQSTGYKIGIVLPPSDGFYPPGANSPLPISLCHCQSPKSHFRPQARFEGRVSPI